MADKRYTLAHPLDEGNIFTGGKAKVAGDTILLNENAARHLASAGYLNLDKSGDPAEAGSAESKPAKKASRPRRTKSAQPQSSSTSAPDDASA